MTRKRKGPKKRKQSWRWVGLAILLLAFALMFTVTNRFQIFRSPRAKPQPSPHSLWHGEIFDIKKEHESQFLSYPGVVGVGVGWENHEYRIRVYVEEKKPSLMSLIPLSLEGYPVEIVETNGFYAFQHHGKWRPICGGISIGQPYWGTGTMSVTVYDRDSGQKFILSNNHVLAKSNSDQTDWGKVGDEIIQPGQADGGRGSLGGEVVGYLYSWVEIRAGDITRPIEENPDNYVDCALAQVDEPSLCNNEIMEIGLVSQTINAELGMNVEKSGRTTGLTHGIIRDISFTGWVDYQFYFAKFVDQIVVEPIGDDPFSLPGDSGSLVVDSDNNAVGLLFAGDAERGTAILNPISLVFDTLNVHLPQAHDATQPVLLDIVPIQFFTIETQPVEGDIYLDSIWLGRGYVRNFAETGLHTVSFGSVQGYETPEPFEIELKADGYGESWLTIVYKQSGGSWIDWWLELVCIIEGFWIPRFLLFFVPIGVAAAPAVLYLRRKNRLAS